MSAFVFNTSPSIIFGSGQSRRIGDAVKMQLGTSALVVTDAGIVRTGMLGILTQQLLNLGLRVAVFDDVTPDPTEDQVLGACAKGRECGATSVIGFGGGSPMDVAKLASVVLKSDEPLEGMYGVNNVKGCRLPLLLIPTTAGTGSEVTPIAIITTRSHEKKGVVSPVLLPDVALLDPELTLGLPHAATAATGIDAMVHAIEAYTSLNANNNPISRGLAIQALKLLGSSIECAVADGTNLQARSDMLLGAMLAGQAFANSPVAAVHALAYPLGSGFKLSHGVSNAVMLVEVLRFNASVSEQAYAELLPHSFEALPSGDSLADCNLFISQMTALIERLGIQKGLRHHGIPEHAIARLAEEAMGQSRLLVNNPRPVTLEDALAMYQRAW